MKSSPLLRILTVAVALMDGIILAQGPPTCPDQGTWSTLSFSSQNGGNGGNIDTPILLTDGRVMAQYAGYGTPSGNPYQDWYALTPDATGNYVTGTWSELASLYDVWMTPFQYGPYAFAPAVLPDGKVIVQGGERNPAGGGDEVNLGAIYDPFHNLWSPLQPPPNWPAIGDAQSVVLANGIYMVAACGSGNLPPCDTGSHEYAFEQALLDESSGTWVIVNSNKLDRNSEEGYTLLPGGNVLTVDINTGLGYPTYEIYTPGPGLTAGTWNNYANMPYQLYGNVPGFGDIGPAILLPNGNVLGTGTILSLAAQTSGITAIYHPSAQTWSAGPVFPMETFNGLQYGEGMGDETAVLLPNGNVFLAAHDDPLNNYFFYEYNPAVGTQGALCTVNGAPSSLATNATNEQTKMLLLPTGQVFLTSSAYGHANPGPYYYIYTPAVPQINPAWPPTISSIPNGNHLVLGSTNNLINGTQFNGFSQAGMQGDDYQSATNYPLVQITDSSNQVLYARTHGHSTMGVATGITPTYTYFDVPTNLQLGQGTLVVIANGIASIPQPVTICNSGGSCQPQAPTKYSASASGSRRRHQ